MKNFRTPNAGLKWILIALFFLQLFSLNSVAQNQKTSANSFEKIILKVPGINTEEVFLKYKNFILEKNGVVILGHTSINEYLLVELNTTNVQVIEVLQPLKDNGFYFDFLFENPSEQKLQELFSNDPLIPFQ